MGEHPVPHTARGEPKSLPVLLLACRVLVIAPHLCTFLHSCRTHAELSLVQFITELQCVSAGPGTEAGPCPARGVASTMHTLSARTFTGFPQNMMIRRAVAVMPKSVGRRTFSSGETYEEIVGM